MKKKPISKQQREEEVLLGLVELFLASGKAIGSNTLRENGFDHISSAELTSILPKSRQICINCRPSSFSLPFFLLWTFVPLRFQRLTCRHFTALCSLFFGWRPPRSQCNCVREIPFLLVFSLIWVAQKNRHVPLLRYWDRPSKVPEPFGFRVWLSKKWFTAFLRLPAFATK